MRFEFGEKVRVKATLIRMHEGSQGRYWKKFECTNFEAIFLGYRTLYDGRFGWDYVEDGSEYFFDITKTYRGALVCRKGFNPIRVFLEDIEKLT